MSVPAYDVLIVGGGVVGSSIAYFLSASPEGRKLRVAVVEQDPSYTRSSTALSVGGIRQQFSTRENIQLSLFSAEFFRRAGATLSVRGEEPDLGFREGGYLFLATAAGVSTMEANHAVQVGLGAEVQLFDREALARRFPWMNVEDLARGSLGIRGEGWLDPYSLLHAFRKKAEARGVSLLRDSVAGVTCGSGRVEAVALERAGSIPIGSLVNAAGPRAADLAMLAGISDLPVHPRKRFVYRVQGPEALPGCPLVIDPSGVYFRPEGEGLLCGVSPPPDRDPDTLDLEMNYDLFHEVVWPALAHRVPILDSLRLGSSWAGHYAFNPLDQNAILGPHPELRNLFFANGFSGHGLQHSPGVGRAISELILHGEFRTLDLTRLSFDRFARGALIREENVV